MSYHSKRTVNTGKKPTGGDRKLRTQRFAMGAFSLIEVIAALSILALFSASVLVVIDRSMATAADLQLRTKAFEIARENMEKLLTSDSVQESVEYGTSDRYPEIEWQTTVETFFEPLTSRMWVQAICSAAYSDSQGQEQTVELTHWLTNLSKEDIMLLLQGKQKEKFEEWLANQLIGTIEDAAVYVGVSIETIEQWVDKGMLTTEDGSFVKDSLDLFEKTNGDPSPEQIAGQTDPTTQLPQTSTDPTIEPDIADDSSWLDEIEPITGLTYREVEEMSFEEIWELLQSKYH